MKEFIDKLIERLEEEKAKGIYDSGSVIGVKDAWAKAISIVNELAEEYINTSTISKMETVGWIPCSERLPELGQMCLCSVNTEKYKDAPHPIVIGWFTEFYKNKFADWYTAWMPLPAPYTENKVSEMPTGWIPCERELPKEGKKVLVTYEDRYIGGHNGVCEGMYVYGWKEWDISDYMCKDDFRVIAWCELPAPYTEGE